MHTLTRRRTEYGEMCVLDDRVRKEAVIIVIVIVITHAGAYRRTRVRDERVPVERQTRTTNAGRRRSVAGRYRANVDVRAHDASVVNARVRVALSILSTSPTRARAPLSFSSPDQPADGKGAKRYFLLVAFVPTTTNALGNGFPS